MTNLDRDPRFWLTFAMLLPFLVALELVCRVDDALARHRAPLRRGSP